MALLRAPTCNPSPSLHGPTTLGCNRIICPWGWDSWGKIAVLRDGFDARAWGEPWDHEPSSDAGIDMDSSANPRNFTRPSCAPKYALLPVPFFPLPHFQNMQPTPHPPNPRPEQAFLAKSYDGTHGMRIATPVAPSALSQKRPRCRPPASSGPWACRHSRCRRSSVLVEMEGTSTGAALGGVSVSRRTDVTYPWEGGELDVACTRCCRTSSGACLIPRTSEP